MKVKIFNGLKKNSIENIKRSLRTKIHVVINLKKTKTRIKITIKTIKNKTFTKIIDQITITKVTMMVAFINRKTTSEKIKLSMSTLKEITHPRIIVIGKKKKVFTRTRNIL